MDKLISELPHWDPETPQESLLKVHQWSLEICNSAIRWYEKKRRIRKLLSQSIRFLTLTLAGIGMLLPLLESAIAIKIPLGKWGYVFFAASGALILFDHFFGISSAWMRFMKTELALRKELDIFMCEWLKLQIEQVTGDRYNTIVEITRKFVMKIHETVAEETNYWLREFEGNMETLNKHFKKLNSEEYNIG